MSERTGQRVVLVLGPHRGGTSAVTRILNLLGVELGPDEDLIGGGAPQNPKGFFENRQIMLLNDELLGRLGGSWRDPPLLEPGWEDDHSFTQIRARARRILAANFSESVVWGFKDPRTCLTLPFWRDLVGDARYVICHRNALEVARSLGLRDQLSPRHGVELWARHMAAAISHTSGAPRIFVSFEELFSGREAVIQDLARFVGAPERAIEPELRAQVDDWLEGELKHHVLTLADVLGDSSVPDEARVLQLTLDLAIGARAGEPSLRGEGPGGPVDAALDAAASSYEQRRLSQERRRYRSPRRDVRPDPGARSQDGLGEVPFGDPVESVDFIVIAASHSGSAVLRSLLLGHPELVLTVIGGDPLLAAGNPIDADRADGLERSGRKAGTGPRRGLIWPLGMSGGPAAAVRDLAAWVAASAPKAKLIALVRDPIERAIDHHQLAVRSGAERRELGRALREQLSTGALRASREHPTTVNGYLTWGEYGRIIAAYRRRLPRAVLLVLPVDELERDPSPAVGRVLRFLEVDDSWRPPNVKRHPRLSGEDPLVSPKAARGLVSELEELVFPLAGPRAAQARRAFAYVFDSWNRLPDGDKPALQTELLADLQAHFAADALQLETVTGVRVPWIDPPARAQRVPGSDPPEVSIIVLADEQPSAAATAVASVLDRTDGSFELLLVDNASGERWGTELESLAARVGARYIRIDDKLAATAAWNLGIGEARAAEVALLDDDCTVTAGWLSNLRSALACAPDLAAVGPRSNYADLRQGGIWLDDTTARGVARFASSFNRPDPDRRFEVDWLASFAMLARRSALTVIGGFDEAIGCRARAERDLGERLRAAGFRMLCAGDTFVLHLGGSLAKLAALDSESASESATPSLSVTDSDGSGRLIEDGAGRVFEVRGGVAHETETEAVMRLVREGRRIESAAGDELERLQIGTPIGLYREIGSDGVWLLDAGERRRVTGDSDRIRRLPRIALAPAGALATLAEGKDVAIEDALPPVPGLPALAPSTPAEIPLETLATLEQLSAKLGGALEQGRGYSLIRLGSREARLLDEGARPVRDLGDDQGAGRDLHPTAAELHRAIVDADAVGVPVARNASTATLQRVLSHLDHEPPLRFAADLAYGLLGFDPVTGKEQRFAPLRELLAGRPLAVVGPLAADAHRFGDAIGYDVRLTVGIDRPSQLDDAFVALAASRDAYDAVLVAAGVSGRILCSRLARELDVVALELGEALGRLLYVRHGRMTHTQIEARWAAERYVREAAEPAPDPPHPLEGKLVREPGKAVVYWVERGLARRVNHKALLGHLGEVVFHIAASQLAEIPRGLPLSVVRGRGSGQLYILIGGCKVPLAIELPVPALDWLDLDAVPARGPAIKWFPGAPVGWPR